ncbi:MAG: hypothetical protein JXB62_22655 [Pirellulales bacterium]|nr:hypothetical protein [Pirellulales bacterium]
MSIQLVVTILGTIALAAIGIMIGSFFNPKTRVAGVILLMVGLLALFVLGTAGFALRRDHVVRQEAARLQVMADRLRVIGDEMHGRAAFRPHDSPSIPLEATRPNRAVADAEHVGPVTPNRLADQDATAAAETTAVVADPSETAATRQDPGRLFRAIGRALGKGISDNRKHGMPPRPLVEADAVAEETATATKDAPPADDTDQAAAIGEPADDAAKPAKATEDTQGAMRPAWIDGKPQRTADGYQITVTVGPYTTLSECERALPAALQSAAAEYIEIVLGPRAARRVQLPTEYLRDRIMRDTWEETVEIALDPDLVVLGPDETNRMICLHHRLLFDSSAKREVERLWDEEMVAGRLWYTGTGVVSVLVLLSVLLGVLKIDEATQGAYRGRLGTAGVAVALGVLVMAYCAVVLIDGSTTTLSSVSSALVPPTGPEIRGDTIHHASTPGRTVVSKATGGLVVVLPLVTLLLAAGVAVPLLIGRKSRTAGLTAAAFEVAAVVAVVVGLLVMLG